VAVPDLIEELAVATLGDGGQVETLPDPPGGIAVQWARELISKRRYVLDSDWGSVQPTAADQNAHLKSHSWEEYARWHLGLTEGPADHTKAKYAFVYGDFRRLHRIGIIACLYRAAEWRHKAVERAAYNLPQGGDRPMPRRTG
jgi:hypothetical protein